MIIEPSKHVQGLQAFPGGKITKEEIANNQVSRIIHLDSNENPRGPAKQVLEAIREKSLNRYPDPSGTALKQKLSEFYFLNPNRIALGNGSNELIDLLVRAFCLRPDSILISQASFIAYRMCALQQNIEVEEVKMGAGFRADLGALLKRAQDSVHVKLIFLANPNNPTGTHHSALELDSFLQEIKLIRNGSILVVLDAAYSEYATLTDLADPLPVFRKHENTVLLKTFSKAYGLAGLRIGYAFAQPEVIDAIEKVRQPYHVNALAQAAAVAALNDQDYVWESHHLNRQGMAVWESALVKLEIPYLPSQGNFILINTAQGLGLSGDDVAQESLALGAGFRSVTNYGLPDMLRISIGTEAENQIGIRALTTLKRTRRA